MMHGILRSGSDAVTPIATPRGRVRELTLFADNSRERLFDPVELRVAIFDCWDEDWKILPLIYLNSVKYPFHTIVFERPEHVGGVSITRKDNPHATVAWTIV